MLRHADRLSVPERAPLLEEYAAELYIAHRFGDSARAAAEAVALRRGLGDDVALVRSLVELSRRRWMAGERQGAQAAVEEAELVAERSGDADSLAHVGAHRLSLLVLDRPASEALDAVPEAIARARAARRNDLLALCLDYRGCAQVLRGEWCWLDGRAEDCRLLAEALLARRRSRSTWMRPSSCAGCCAPGCSTRNHRPRCRSRAFRRPSRPGCGPTGARRGRMGPHRGALRAGA